ncbi:MAG: hypothetical protein HYS14_03995 [Candidatus Rokubacteria bacterium]|nr:hypothetical protein [Candidatus Rokubacteria bacterium]
MSVVADNDVRPPERCFYAKKRANARPDFRISMTAPAQDSVVAAPFAASALAQEGYRAMGDTLGYTVSWFVDDQLVALDSNLDLPIATRLLDPTHWQAGSHSIRASFWDDHKHFGSASIVVLVPPNPKEGP